MGYAIRDDGQGWRAVDGPEDVGVNESYSDAQPVPTVGGPTVVTMRQARLALLRYGLLSQVDTFVASMPGVAGDAARITWEFAGDVQRSDALLAQLAGLLGLSDTQLDDLFRLAATL